MAKVTIQTDTKTTGKKLPAGTVTESGEKGLVINVAKLNSGLIRDQRAKMVSSMGCYSNPGGPSC